jgi:glycosyltransferase involved in cell wall biosynthesis
MTGAPAGPDGAQAGRRARVLFLNPFHGGSHRAFAEGWAKHSRHEFTLITLPARFWKWRMRGAALHFARKVADPAAYDALVVTDLMSLSDLRALWGEACPPALAYFHENQLSYPLPPGEAIDYQFGFTDITTCLAARRVLFNSRFQHDAFFARLPGFLGMMPEFQPRWVIEAIRARAGVLHPGVDLGGAADRAAAGADPEAPLVVWNHRWEFDKNPAAFFAALDAALARGREFRLALLGENFQVVPKEFEAARDRFGARLVHYGYVEDRAAYLAWLRRGDIVVSTSDQENFGMAIVEAIAAGCLPLLPRRLAYPEILPEQFHGRCLYSDGADLAARLEALLAGGARGKAADGLRADLAMAMRRHDWSRAVVLFDREIDLLLTRSDESAPGQPRLIPSQ